MNVSDQSTPDRRGARANLPSRLTSLAVLGAFVISVPLVLQQLRDARQAGLRPITMNGQWIRTQPRAFSACFRREFTIAGNVKNAWLAIAAREGFEVTVNGNPVVKQPLWRPTRPFQNGVSAKGQRLTPPTTALGLNFPREYQWTGHESFRVPIFVDLREHLRSGPNVIAVELESRSTETSFCIEGEILLFNEARISLATDPSWKGEPVPPGVQYSDWREPDYNARSWRDAVIADRPDARQVAQFDRRMFSQPFTGSWVQHPDTTNRERVEFTCQWELEAVPEDACLRLATNRHYQLRINGSVVTSGIADHGLDSGDWLLANNRSRDTPAKPELLDPDEVGSLFQGTRFESPRHGDPTADALRHKENVLNVTRDKARNTTRSAMPGTYDPKRTLEETRRTPDKPYAFPDPVTPKSLTRDRSQAAYHGWDIANLLQAGTNRISIELLPPISSRSFGWPARVAVDGFATDTAATSLLPPATDWRSLTESDPVPSAVEVTGIANKSGLPFPNLDFRGRAKTRHSSIWIPWLGMVGLLIVVSWRFSKGTALAVPTLGAAVVAPTVVLLAALVLRWSFAERHEVIWFLSPRLWWGVLGLAVVSAFVPSGLRRFWTAGKSSAGPDANQFHLPDRAFVWRFAVLWIVLLSFFLRVHKLDFQPLDDDEYASTQAVLAILETGAPQFATEDVWYTRSPLFHYSTAAIAWVFGPNLWTLRIWCALFGAATAWLTYHIGRTLFRSRWLGLAGMLLVAVHPFEIYTSHIIRFYQMQQFFALLTVYCFCRGFVTDQCQRYRYVTVVCFLATVLSQEISVVMAFPLAFVALLFGEDKSWKANLKLLAVCAVAIGLIGVDYIVFQTRCLTRTEGVSYTMEAAVKPHFWFVDNLFSLFIGYSSLHLSLSVAFVAGLPLMFRRRHRDRTNLAILFVLLGSIVMTNLLVTGVSLRYQYWMIPLWILCSLQGMRLVVHAVSNLVSFGVGGQKDSQRKRTKTVQWTSRALAAAAFACVMFSWSLWRIPGSYESKLLGDSTGAFRFVRTQLQPGDQVAATEPHTHAALMEAGRVDYDLAVPLLYDFVMLKDGHLIDRNGGARSVSSLRQLMDVCRDNDRVWVVVNREKFRSRGKNIRWEYPSARVELFLRQNLELKHRTYLWSVFLWDASRGFRRPFRAGAE